MAAEDRRFFTHPGVDLRSVARALWQNTKSGRTVSGASTITQQLARSLMPRRKTFIGKIGEMFSALRLEAGHSKEEILELNDALHKAGIVEDVVFAEPTPEPIPTSVSE